MMKEDWLTSRCQQTQRHGLDHAPALGPYKVEYPYNQHLLGQYGIEGFVEVIPAYSHAYHLDLMNSPFRPCFFQTETIHIEGQILALLRDTTVGV